MPNQAIAFPWQYKHVIGNTQINDGPCVLHTITVNRMDTGSVVATVYDNLAAAGDILAVIDFTPTAVVDVLCATLFFDCQCEHGLYVALSGAPVTADLTVTFK